MRPDPAETGKCWYLDFAFEEKTGLPDTEACGRRILAVDLGINSACTCCVMEPDGTVTGRSFLKLSGENDRLDRATGRIVWRSSTGRGACRGSGPGQRDQQGHRCKDGGIHRKDRCPL